MDRKNYNGDFIEKKKFILSLVAVVIIAVTLFAAAFVMINDRISTLHTNAELLDKPVFNDSDTGTDKEIQYTIKEFDGRIGVFENGDFQYLVDIYVFTLPENDKKLLSKGISVSSEKELNDILSSYY